MSSASRSRPAAPPACRRAAVALAAALLLGGCQATQTYCIDRGLDASDMLRAQVMAGKGGGAVVEATHFYGLGLLVYSGTAWGLGTRTFGRREEASFTFDALMNIGGSEKVVARGAEPGRKHEFNVSSLFEQGQPVYVTTERGFAPWLVLRAGVMVFLGVDVELRGGEMIDFVAGLAGLDPSHDDGPAAAEPLSASPWRFATLGTVLEPFAQVQRAWPPLAGETGRIVLFGDDYEWTGVQADGNWWPSLALDGAPLVHVNGRDVYFFADAPAGEHVLAVNGEEAARLHVVAGTITFVRMCVSEVAAGDPPPADGASRRLKLEPVSPWLVAPDLDDFRYVGEPPPVRA